MIEIKRREWEDIQNKIKFIEEVSKAFVACPKATSVVKAELEMLPVRYESGRTDIREYLVVTYKGGAIAARNCNWNSNEANFEELSKLLFGGYYGEVETYRKCKELVEEYEIVDED